MSIGYIQEAFDVIVQKSKKQELTNETHWVTKKDMKSGKGQ